MTIEEGISEAFQVIGIVAVIIALVTCCYRCGSNQAQFEKELKLKNCVEETQE